MTTAKPAAGFILAEIVDNPHKVNSTLFLPEGRYIDTVTYARVRAVGPGSLTALGVWCDSEIRPGDLVIIGNLSGIDITVNGEKLLLIHEKHVRGLFKGAE